MTHTPTDKIAGITALILCAIGIIYPIYDPQHAWRVLYAVTIGLAAIATVALNQEPQQ